MGTHDDLPLFRWRPPVQFIPFPLERQVGKIRDVARKLSAKTTDRHADHYSGQVTEALVNRLQRLGIPDTAIDEAIGRFWHQVNQEVARMSYRGRTGGDAA